MSESGRSCRKTQRARDERDAIEVDVTEDRVHIRIGRRVVRTLMGGDAATARRLIDDPARFDQFIASKLTR